LIGTNAKLTELSSAIGSRQLEALPHRLQLRREILAEYQTQLRPLGLEFQPNAEHAALAFVSTLAPSNQDRDACVSALDEAGIECRTYYGPPMHCHPVFSPWIGRSQLGVTEDLSARVISLPMSDALGDQEIDRITTAMAGALRV
jgi:dTDP-4-amino-4,6-dideoxygalactose transaminase